MLYKHNNKTQIIKLHVPLNLKHTQTTCQYIIRLMIYAKTKI